MFGGAGVYGRGGGEQGGDPSRNQDGKRRIQLHGISVRLLLRRPFFLFREVGFVGPRQATHGAACYTR